MPAPQSTLFTQAARAKFSSFAIKVPQNWQQPQGEAGDMFRRAFPADQLNTQPGTPALFQPATMLKAHTDTQKMHNAGFGQFIDKICGAICSAWSTWQSTATMTGVVINAVTASLGQVVGPPWAPLILLQGPSSTPMQLKFTTAVATVLGDAWLTYTASLKVPGLPFYPAFAMFPLAVAPPTPNVPYPIAALQQVDAGLAPAVLKQQMVAKLADPNAPYHAELFEAICDAFDKSFQQWKLTTMVTNVLGTGPVPTFAPPVVPAGPVVGGVGTMTPGGFT